MPNNTIITTDQLRIMLFETEDSDNPKFLNTFSYAGNPKNPNDRSSYSFGVLQFDVGHRADAQKFLENNGFNQEDIELLKRHGGLNSEQKNALNKKLQAIPQDKINAFTNGNLQGVLAQVDHFIDTVRTVNPATAQTIADSQELQLRVADFFNQYGSSTIRLAFLHYVEGKSFNFAGPRQLHEGHTLTGEDIRDFLRHTPYSIAARQKFEIATANANKNHKKHKKISDPAQERANRLEIALKQLGVSHPHQSFAPDQSWPQNYTHFDDMQGVSPPVWSEIDESGTNSPSACYNADADF
jgi:hypothetical protein